MEEAVIRTIPHRLHVERRLLAALYIWPQYLCAVDLDRRHFQSHVHAVLFDVLKDAGEALQDDWKAIPLLHEVVKRKRVKGVFKSVDGIEEYVITRLIPMDVTRSEIPSLIAKVRECHHCGK